MKDAWICNLSNGITVVERWIPGELPPWDRLINMCKENSIWVTNLRMAICSETVSLPSHAGGYWQAYQQAMVENVPPENLPVVRGIGYVEDNKIKILWGVRTSTNKAHFYHDSRTTDGQVGIIWKPK